MTTPARPDSDVRPVIGEMPSLGSQPIEEPPAANLHGLPPKKVITAGIDPLISEGQTLAPRLEAAGVPTLQRNYDGVTHEFFGLGALVAKSADAQQLVGTRLREAFAPRA